jgi:hypothetical protein
MQITKTKIQDGIRENPHMYVFSGFVSCALCADPPIPKSQVRFQQSLFTISVDYQGKSMSG